MNVKVDPQCRIMREGSLGKPPPRPRRQQAPGTEPRTNLASKIALFCDGLVLRGQTFGLRPFTSLSYWFVSLSGIGAVYECVRIGGASRDRSKNRHFVSLAFLTVTVYREYAVFVEYACVRGQLCQYTTVQEEQN
jgi:hypothetical protein